MKFWSKTFCAMAVWALAGAAWGQGLPPSTPPMKIPVTVPTPNPGAVLANLAGGVTEGTATAQPLPLSLEDAIARGLRNNLAAVLSSRESDEAKAQRMAVLADLLPRVDASAGEQREKLNLAAFGLSLPGVPGIVGPFDLFQASLAADVPVWNFTTHQSNKAAHTLEGAAAQDNQATRNLVVLAVANQYLLTVADESRVAAAKAELDTANQQIQEAQDMKAAGTIEALSVVRAQVQQQHQQQLLQTEQNDLAKQRLSLARAIGLPPAQVIQLTDSAPYAPLQAPEPEAAVAQAMHSRPDYQAMESLVKADQALVAGAKQERLPSVHLDGNYGTLGHEIDSNHPIYSVGATVQMPVYEGGQYKANILEAETQLRDAQSREADLRANIEIQVRDAILDLQSNAAQTATARSARDLANQELTMARDRFRAGVADNLEVVEAQQAVADSEQNYIGSLYAYNLAKAGLAQALGVAQTSYKQYLNLP